MHDPTTTSGAEDGITGGARRSTIDRIRERAKNGRKPLELPIPRYDGDVWVRFGRVPTQLMRQLASRRNGKGARAANAALLVAACKEVLVVDEHGQKVPAREERVGGDGLPGEIRFDGRFSDLFGLKGDTPEQIAVNAYADDLALASAAKRVIDWQTGADLDELDDDDEDEVDELAGEEEAAT